MARKIEARQDDREGFPHHMLKEIHEQPAVVRRTMQGRLDGAAGWKELGIDEAEARALRRIELVACGTSWHAGLIGKRLFEDLAGVFSTAEIASEYRDWPRRDHEGTLVVTITQSGETSDTLAALRAAKAYGARTAAICNVAGSTIAREADGALLTNAGTEVSIASTKAFSSQVTALLVLAVGLARMRGTLDGARDRLLMESLSQVPDRVEAILRTAGALAEEIAHEQRDTESFFYVGRGYGYPVALEGALKLKETSYVHAEGYPSGEFRHGPIALIAAGVPLVAVVPGDGLRDKVLTNLKEVKEKGGRVIAVGTEGDTELAAIADRVFAVPRGEEQVLPLLASVPLQLMAYHAAVSRGREVDQPRNLTKSVTGD